MDWLPYSSLLKVPGRGKMTQAGENNKYKLLASEIDTHTQCKPKPAQGCVMQPYADLCRQPYADCAGCIAVRDVWQCGMYVVAGPLQRSRNTCESSYTPNPIRPFAWEGHRGVAKRDLVTGFPRWRLGICKLKPCRWIPTVQELVESKLCTSMLQRSVVR